MPELSNFLEKELKDLEQKFLDAISMFDNLSEQEKIQLAYQVDLFQELQDLGLSDVIDKMLKEYAGILDDLLDKKEIGIGALRLTDLENIANLDAATILGKAEAYSKEFKSALVKGFLSGQSTNEIRERLGSIGLASNQTIAAINTARDEYHSTSLAKLFEDEPATRFKLSDFPLDDRTRCSCKSVILNQPKEGWTKEEIDNGAATRIARKYCPKFEGEYSFVNRGGYNCRHNWEII